MINNIKYDKQSVQTLAEMPTYRQIRNALGERLREQPTKRQKFLLRPSIDFATLDTDDSIEIPRYLLFPRTIITCVLCIHLQLDYASLLAVLDNERVNVE
jgi:hypothetical protein